MKTLRDYAAQLPLGLDTPVLGELPVTADGVVVGNDIEVFARFPAGVFPVKRKKVRVLKLTADRVDFTRFYSTRAAAERATKETP